jgi:hypothetical protein
MRADKRRPLFRESLQTKGRLDVRILLKAQRGGPIVSFGPGCVC